MDEAGIKKVNAENNRSVDLYQHFFTIRFMLVGPSRVQGRIYQRQLPLKEPGAWPGVHISGKCVGHFLLFCGWTIKLCTFCLPFTSLHFHCGQMLREGLLGLEWQEREGKAEICLAYPL